MFFDSGLWQFTAGERARMAGTVGVGLLAASVGILRLGALGWLIGAVYRGAEAHELALPTLAVVGLMLLRGVLEYARNMMAHRTAALVQRTLRAALYDKAIALGPAHFGLARTGDVLIAMIDGVEQLETYFGQYLPQLLVAILTPVLVFAFVAFLDLRVALLLLGFSLITLIAPSAFHRWDGKNSQRRQRAYKDFASEFLDAIQGLATLKAFGQSKAKARVLADKAHEVFRSTMWVLATNSLSRGIVDTGIAVGAACVLAYGAYRVSAGTLDLSVLLIILMMGIEVFRPQRDLRALMHKGLTGQAAAQGIQEFLAEPVRVQFSPAGDETPHLTPKIRFEDVHFSYPGARSASHKGLSFTASAGERLGFVGASGAGKSTVVKLLLRFHDPDKGRICLGEHDLRDLCEHDLRRYVSVVSQDTYLFHGTVAENLRFGKSGATNDELEQAARAANAHGFIESLPQGYETIVGERGIRLSGGQRQRIAIARALLRDAPVLILDEALSSVDAENESIIGQALERLMRGRTTLTFAHRLSSVINADRILVLKDGEIIDQGTHSQLLAKGGEYHRLMAAQVSEGPRETPLGSSRDKDGDISREAVKPPQAHSKYMEPTDAILRAEGMGWRDAFRELLKSVIPYKKKLTLTFVFGVVRVLALIGVGTLSALAVAAVKTGQPFSGYIIALAIVAPLAGLLHWLESWLAHDMAFRMLAEMRIALFKKLERLAPAYLLRRRSGDLVAMATDDVELVEYFFAHTVTPAVVAILVPTLVLGILGYFAWPLAVALAPFLVLVGLSPFLARHRVDSLGSRAREALGSLNAQVVDTLQGISEIVAFEQASTRRDELLRQVARHHQARLLFFRDLTAQTSLLEVATGLGGLAVVITGAYLSQTGSLNNAWLPLLALLAMAAFLPVSEIAEVGRQLADTLGATRRLHAVHSEPVPIKDGSGVRTLEYDNGLEVGITDLNFAYYEGAEPALTNINLNIPAGSTLALVGPSGAGKTTLAHLLLRFFDPASGCIRIGGHDTRDFEFDHLRQCVALVTQDTYLFHDTLRNNILLAKPEASDAELNLALTRASLNEFVASLPYGLDTLVGERGVRLSGGQRQRVAIARAFLRNAPILILDEATSHLDAVNERSVHAALDDLARETTTIIIAHRLSTIRNADQIAVLEAGQLKEQGTHDTLLRTNGLYRTLIEHQIDSVAQPATGETRARA